MKSKTSLTKKLVCLLMAVMMMVGMLAVMAIPAAADETAVNNSRNGVAAVMLLFEDSASRTYLPTNEIVFGTGSCFFVGNTVDNPQYLITNYHVIDDYYYYGKGDIVNLKINNVSRTGRMKIRVYFDTVDTNDFIEAYPVEVNDKYDVALLKLEQPTNKRKALPIKSPTDDMVSSQVYVLGFPGLTENYDVAATSHFKVSDVSVTSGVISRLLTQQGTGWQTILIDASIKSGNSGGPLITSDGYVIGINTWSKALANLRDVNGQIITTNIEEDFFSVNIEHALTLMNRNGVINPGPGPDPTAPPEDPTVPPTDGPGDPTVPPTVEPTTTPPPVNGLSPIWIVAIVALAVIVIAVVIIIVLASKKKAPAPAPAPAPQQAPPVRPAYPQAPANRPPTPPAAPPMPPANTGAGETSVLNSGAGETTVLGGGASGFALVRKSNNERVRITKGEFVIGKERRRVDYCISDDNSVSRTHCKINVRGGKCYITDLGSTNCTYVNGVKLAPNQELALNSGDKIKISDIEFDFIG